MGELHLFCYFFVRASCLFCTLDILASSRSSDKNLLRIIKATVSGVGPVSCDQGMAERMA